MATVSKAKTSKAAKQNSNTTLYIVGGALLLLAVLVVVLVLNNASTATTAATPTADVPAEWIDGTSYGKPDAPVTVQMWEDFMCPHCQSWTATVKPRVVEEYVKNGTVRLEYHPFPLQQFAPGSQMGAQAAWCAADQNLFWPMHDKLFSVAATRGQAGMEYDSLLAYATELGLDTNAWSTCMNNLVHQDTMLQSLQQAGQLGLTGTPSIIVNGKLIPGADNFNTLKAEIDAAAGS